MAAPAGEMPTGFSIEHQAGVLQRFPEARETRSLQGGCRLLPRLMINVRNYSDLSQ